METPRVIAIMGNSTKLNEFEVENLTKMKQYIEEYLKAGLLNKNSYTEVQMYLEKVKVDDVLLSKYLRGRKNNPFIAWDTIRRYAENRFQNYPEVFTGETIPEKVRELISTHVVGVMKQVDKFGRRIVFVDMTKWDAKLHTLDDITTAAVVGCERFWKDQEVMDNGIILIENTQGFGVAHARQHTMHKMIRMRNVLMFSYPVAIKGVYYLNVPTVFSLVFKMSKPLLPKKLRSRMFLYSANHTPSELFDIVSPEILPTWVGGTLSIEEAAEDISFFEEKFT